ncbi:AAA family ATPase [Curvibacter delicatus]|jgi:SpoVK/Ycf46/Vps4 family AAA+-type ATPase|uniref:AAA family ATPase n=1 Tax=Curvibacter delicatus TaxID=80879 RepID=UPI00082C91B9|nr:ATP-binding protein [Curvibacter delicatus]
MTRYHDVLTLAAAALDGDVQRALTTCKVIAANEGQTSNLRRLLLKKIDQKEKSLRGISALNEVQLPPQLAGLLLQLEPKLRTDQVDLPDQVREELDEFLEDCAAKEYFSAHGVALGNRALLIGPPGNGKTTLAGAMALALDLPIFQVDFSNIISRHLGETGSKLASVFRGLEGRPCVLFMDEMETVLAARGGTAGTQDIGEMRRIVSTLLLEMDRLPDSVVLIGATNHPELLDRAVQRRFHYHWTLPAPDDARVRRWMTEFAERYPGVPIAQEMPLPVADGRSISQLETEALKWCRGWIRRQARADHGK